MQNISSFDQFNNNILSLNVLKKQITAYVLAFYSCIVSLLTLFLPLFIWPQGIIPLILGIVFFSIHVLIRKRSTEKEIQFSTVFNNRYKKPQTFWDRSAKDLLYIPISLALGNHTALLVFPQLAEGFLFTFMKESENIVYLYTLRLAIILVNLYFVHLLLVWLLQKEFIRNITLRYRANSSMKTIIGIVVFIGLIYPYMLSINILFTLLETILVRYPSISSFMGTLFIGSISISLFRILFIGTGIKPSKEQIT